MRKYHGAAQDEFGNRLPTTAVTVINQLTGSIAPIFADDETTPLANPTSSDSNGLYTFKAAAGRYTITVSGQSALVDVTILDDPSILYLVNSGASILYGEAAYISGDGTAAKAQSDGTNSEASVVAICLETALTNGSTGRFRTFGLIDRAAGTPGALGYLGQDGEITETVPDYSAGDFFSTILGRQFTSDKFNVRGYNRDFSVALSLAPPSPPPIGNNTGVYTNGTIEGLHVDGSLVYVVGSFTTVTDSGGTYTRNRGACLNVATGLWTAWNPNIVGGTAYTVYKDATHVYVGTRQAAPTFGGVAVSYAARVDPTTGVRDATWAPTFNGSVRGFDTTGNDTFVCGSFTTVNGLSRSCVCKFTSGALTSWNPTTTDAPPNTLESHTGASIALVSIIKVISSSVVFASRSLRATRDAGGYWCGSWGIADTTTGVIAQSTEGNALINMQGIGENSASVVGSSLRFAYITNFGGTPIYSLPISVDSGKDIYVHGSVSASGAYTPAANFQGTGGNFYALCPSADGDELVGGEFSGYTGQTLYKYLVKYDPATGTLDTNFHFWTRMNAAGQSGPPNVYGVKPLTDGAVVAVGPFGSVAGAHQYDGNLFQGILILDSLTGARR